MLWCTANLIFLRTSVKQRTFRGSNLENQVVVDLWIKSIWYFMKYDNSSVRDWLSSHELNSSILVWKTWNLFREMEHRIYLEKWNFGFISRNGTSDLFRENELQIYFKKLNFGFISRNLTSADLLWEMEPWIYFEKVLIYLERYNILSWFILFSLTWSFQPVGCWSGSVGFEQGGHGDLIPHS